jgi:TrmH family RNA methyltransferase
VVAIGRHHPSLARVRRLSRQRRDREDEDLYVVEGKKLVRDAIDAGCDVVEVLVDDVMFDSIAVDGAFDELDRGGIPVMRAPSGALARALGTVTPQPIAAVVRRGSTDVDTAIASAGSLALVLAGVSDPGNAGTIMRTAEAAGAGALLFCDGSVDPYNPKCVRASAGSLFRVRVSTGGAGVDVLEKLRAGGFTRVGTSVSGGRAPDAVDLRGPVALALGNEAHGLPAGLDDQLDVRITIPMHGRVESLNVGMAGAVICFEALRQRRGGG